MNRRVNKCIRTYERKKCKEAVVPVPKVVISSLDIMKGRNRVLLNNNSNIIEEKDVDNDSMYNDPFETTFDRLIKNARYEILLLLYCIIIINRIVCLIEFHHLCQRHIMIQHY